MKYFFSFLSILLFSCEAKEIIKCNQVDMENTIILGADITIDKKTEANRNSIIAFKNSNKVTILRILALPGDEVEINNGEIFVNKKLHPKPKSGKKIYTIYLRNPSLFEHLTKFKFSPYSTNYSMFSLSDAEYDEIIRMNIVDSIYTLPVDSNQIQSGIVKNKFFKYSNSYFFGPLKIPKINTIIDDNIVSIIPQYLSQDDIGKKIDEDYFFCIGDNFPEAKDSRFIGLVPRSSIIGVVDGIQKVNPINISPNKEQQ